MRQIDTASLKHDHPVEHILEKYGIELRPSGRALIGRCPFHGDGGRPNLYVYPSSQRWHCYRCSTGGDVISFVQRIEGVGFRDAVQKLTGEPGTPRAGTDRFIRATRGASERTRSLGPDERACLATAVELYHGRLLSDPPALAYVKARGLDMRTIQRNRLGYVAGDELADYLRWRRLPIGLAIRVGLLNRDGSEFLTDRIVVPEIRKGQSIWLIGRTIGADDARPKYLGLWGAKPLLGWDAARGAREVFVVEGVFDWLTLRMWGFPALALVGTHAGPAGLRELGKFERIVAIFDSDDAGQAAAEQLTRVLGTRVTSLRLPWVKDVAELATIPDGRQIFSELVGQSGLARAA